MLDFGDFGLSYVFFHRFRLSYVLFVVFEPWEVEKHLVFGKDTYLSGWAKPERDIDSFVEWKTRLILCHLGLDDIG